MWTGKLGARTAFRKVPGKDDASSWDVAKWLIPSVSALFIVVGYIAKFAHFAFLGFDPGLLEPNEYIATTGDFLRWTLHLPESGWAAWRHALWDAPHLISVVPALILGIGVHIWRYRSRTREQADLRLRHRAQNLTVTALLCVLVLRVVALDAPIARLEGALAANIVWRDSGPGGSTPQYDRLSERLDSEMEDASWPSRLLASRASTIWDAKRCNHQPVLHGQDKVKRSCSSVASEGVEDGEGLAHLLANLMLLTLAIWVLLDHSSVWRTSIAWLAIFSCMALAITFGKLGHSLQYEYTYVGLKTASNFATDTASTQQTSLDTEHLLEGVVLHSDKSWTTVAVQEVQGCESAVKIWRVANSEVLWERDIFKTDILLWSASKTSTADCKGDNTLYPDDAFTPAAAAASSAASAGVRKERPNHSKGEAS